MLFECYLDQELRNLGIDTPKDLSRTQLFDWLKELIFAYLDKTIAGSSSSSASGSPGKNRARVSVETLLNFITLRKGQNRFSFRLILDILYHIQFGDCKCAIITALVRPGITDQSVVVFLLGPKSSGMGSAFVGLSVAQLVLYQENRPKLLDEIYQYRKSLYGDDRLAIRIDQIMSMDVSARGIESSVTSETSNPITDDNIEALSAVVRKCAGAIDRGRKYIDGKALADYLDQKLGDFGIDKPEGLPRVEYFKWFEGLVIVYLDRTIAGSSSSSLASGSPGKNRTRVSAQTLLNFIGRRRTQNRFAVRLILEILHYVQVGDCKHAIITALVRPGSTDVDPAAVAFLRGPKSLGQFSEGLTSGQLAAYEEKRPILWAEICRYRKGLAGDDPLAKRIDEIMSKGVPRKRGPGATRGTKSSATPGEDDESEERAIAKLPRRSYRPTAAVAGVVRAAAGVAPARAQVLATDVVRAAAEFVEAGGQAALAGVVGAAAEVEQATSVASSNAFWRMPDIARARLYGNYDDILSLGSPGDSLGLPPDNSGITYEKIAALGQEDPDFKGLGF